MRSSAALAAAGQVARGAAAPKDIAISSGNGMAATAKAVEMLKSGADTLDAVIAGVNIVELDPNEDSVGYGGLPNEEGVVELDASVMHGPTRRCGAVAAIRGIKTPSKIAKLVMEQTTHVLIVGDGALRFAKDWGYKEEDLLTEHSRMAWMVWKQSLRDAGGRNNWTGITPSAKKAGLLDEYRQRYPNASEELLAYAVDRALHPITGTINCLALNTKGEMSGVTTTSGLSWKIPGRVGDSPIIGAGLYVDQDVGAAGSTGLGEENIRIAGAHTVVENMRHGMSPKESITDALKRVVRNYENDRKRLEQFDLNFYALRKDGEYAAGTLFNRKRPNGEWAQTFSVNDGGASRREPCFYLYER